MKLDLPTSLPRKKKKKKKKNVEKSPALYFSARNHEKKNWDFQI